MTATLDPTGGFGFKRLTTDNWLTADPVWQYFAHSPGVNQAEAWAADVLKYQLHPVVPLPLRRMFEVARGALVYGFLFYPLLALGTDQLFRVLEAAVDAKCKTLGAPVRTKHFFNQIDWLLEAKIISEPTHRRWGDIRQIRNDSTHARDQHVYRPDVAEDTLRLTVELINGLFW